MHSFTDSEGRKWTFVINVLAVRRVKAQVDIDLLELLNTENSAFQKIVEDPIAMTDVMLAVLEEDLQRADVSDEDFLRALDNEQIVLDASRALLDAVLSFSPKPKAQLKKKAFGKVWEAVDRQTETQIAQGMEVVDSPEFDRLVTTEAAKALKTSETDGDLSSDSPPASE